MMAHFIEPMLCVAAAELPQGSEWTYELKLDGYRGLGHSLNGRSRLLSRNGKDLSERFPDITKALQHLPDRTVVGGEIVALDGDGRPSFSLLQNSNGREHTIAFYAFDVLLLAEQDLMGLPLESRREILRTRLIPRLPEPIRLSDLMYCRSQRARGWFEGSLRSGVTVYTSWPALSGAGARCA